MQELVVILKKMLGHLQFSPAMTEILQTIIDGTWTSIRYTEILAEHKVRSNSVEFKKESLDVALQYARLCLVDDALSEEETTGMNILKRLLFIEEGDFYKYDKKPEVTATPMCLSIQLEWLRR